MKMFLIRFHSATLHIDLNILNSFIVKIYKENIINPIMKMFLIRFHSANFTM